MFNTIKKSTHTHKKKKSTVLLQTNKQKRYFANARDSEGEKKKISGSAFRCDKTEQQKSFTEFMGRCATGRECSVRTNRLPHMPTGRLVVYSLYIAFNFNRSRDYASPILVALR